MSVNASKHELNQLIYRHLKEHGFPSAADELQRHITQEETNISVSLLDIYKSWLNDSKRKKKSNSTKRSKTGEQTTPTKAKSATPRKKTDKPGKKTVSPKKSAPAKKKKGKDKAAAEKSKLQPSDKAVAAGGEDLDSDSSLDVEKWKNLIQQMTEDDIAKMEMINSLDSSAPQPPKKRVRKPREKPPAKKDIPVQQDNGTVEKSNKVGEKTVTKTPVKERTPKKTGTNNTENVSSSNTPTQIQNLNTVDGKTATATLLPAKHLQTTVPQTPRGQTIDEAPSEPKKKKKHKKDKETKENKVEINPTEAGNDGKEKDSKPVKEKEKAAGIGGETGEDVMEKNKINSENNSESIFQEKKAKKRKKEKSGSEENPSDTAKVKKVKKKRIVDSEGNSEPAAEEINETKEQTLTDTTKVNSEGEIQQNIEEKKVKKKKQKAPTEGNLELVTEELKEDVNQNAEEKVKKKKKKLYSGGGLELATGEVTENIDENVEENKGNSEQKKGKTIKSVDTQEYSEEIVEKKAKKKKRKNPDEDYSEQSVKDDKSEASTIEGTQVHKTTYSTDAESLPPSSRETDSPPKKKKKKKLKSDEVPETAAVSSKDATETIHSTPGDTHKKKKKSSKIIES
ncbi:muscle M-line assembly protein unc-89-like isoform X2 [Melanotaenia boesemani]|uniref:muscle M-line assembly protein unc-89-like isoform X2 n=1 Tax=Melanotaenia boesemani TaxID=1250792 RepID=UPI001C043457|nr:muscle M-line assembly protein unc-89-like isoform X2 [Melanotaenia boesemani]